MNRLLGFILFFIGVGMVLALVLPRCVATGVIAGALLLVGYHLFCC
ncbi:hypothetical protein [Blautia sp. An249]|nr:hypothetical protein [Blautia sp. An249]